jgi:DNA recombination protein RmuC
MGVIMEIQNTVIMLVIGIFLGIGGALFFHRRTATILREQIHNRDIDLTQQNMLLTEMEIKLKEQKAGFDEKMVLVNENKELMKAEFKNLANQILEEKSKSFVLQNSENIGAILNPLREQIGEFKRKVEDIHVKESEGRAALVNEITNLKSLNMQISDDAVNLTKALKGDAKTQGDWGQVVLERVFELSGLEKGREYEVQVHTHDQEGNWFFPDAIVKLPENRDVIVDSKVSLTAYEQYCSADCDEKRILALKNHLLSVRKHIKELSEKQYEKLIEVSSIDFVVLFIPVESAYIAAIKEGPSLFEDGIKSNIILTCPTTLLSVLKVISYTWRLEKQQHNSQEIAEKAGSMYDKFCAFANVFQDVGEGLKNAQNNFDHAVKYLSTGRGNLIKRSKELKKLGVSGKKDLPQKLLEQCDGDSQGDDIPTSNQANGDEK